MEGLHYWVAAAAISCTLILNPVTGDKVANHHYTCCSSYDKEIAKRSFCLIKSYSKESMCGSGKEAIRFRGKKLESYCANPKEKWVKDLQNFLDRKVKCIPKRRTTAKKLPLVEKRVRSAPDGGFSSTGVTHLTETPTTRVAYSTGDPFTPTVPSLKAQQGTEDPILIPKPVAESTEDSVVTAARQVTGDCHLGFSELWGKAHPDHQESQEDEGLTAKTTHSSTIAAAAVGLIAVLLIYAVFYCTHRRRGLKLRDEAGKNGMESEPVVLK
ncbi:fractalkine-like isoform X2 [Carcharodon carcharias]|uniref:fractalkine-like isoform X2 n=1 Tax=Carcharodon carcharias TaxID=13397 RepID=UPI001B7F41B9|nr:fractalkine-like isoform X2 [Carcharodon carcharias]